MYVLAAPSALARLSLLAKATPAPAAPRLLTLSVRPEPGGALASSVRTKCVPAGSARLVVKLFDDAPTSQPVLKSLTTRFIRGAAPPAAAPCALTAKLTVAGAASVRY